MCAGYDSRNSASIPTPRMQLCIVDPPDGAGGQAVRWGHRHIGDIFKVDIRYFFVKTVAAQTTPNARGREYHTICSGW